MPSAQLDSSSSPPSLLVVGADVLDGDFPVFQTIRRQLKSKLVNQAVAAKTLLAVESALGTDSRSPVAYFGLLLTMLEQQAPLAVEDEEKTAVIVSCTYLLSIVFPRIPSPVLKLKFTRVASILAKALDLFKVGEAALVKYVVSCLELLLIAQDSSSWSSSSSKQLFQGILLIATDQRPKVRKRAQEAVKHILSTPPTPLLCHPASLSAIDFCIQYLSEIGSHAAHLASSVSSKNTSAKKSAAAATEARKIFESQCLHLLAFLRLCLPNIVDQSAHSDALRKCLAQLAKALLAVPAKSSSTGSIMITQHVFAVLACFFGKRSAAATLDLNSTVVDSVNHVQLGEEVKEEHELDDADQQQHVDLELMYAVLESLMGLQPNENDVVLAPMWIRAISLGLTRYKLACEQLETIHINNNKNNNEGGEDEEIKTLVELHLRERVPDLVETLFANAYTPLLATTTRAAVIEAAAKAFTRITRSCCTRKMVSDALSSHSDAAGLNTIIKMITESMVDIRFKEAWGGILDIIGGLFECLGRGDSHRLTTPLLERVISFRDDPGYMSSFPYKMELEECLIMAIKQFGIDNFFACVPHNIEGGDPKRPYLISLIIKAMDYSSSTTSSSAASQGPFSMHSLTYFTSSLLPLSSRLFARAATLWQSSSNRSREAKLLETLAAQIWDILPGLCASCPGDVVMTGSGGGFAQLAPLLGRILQSSHGKCPLPEEYTSKGLEPAASSPDLRPLICLALHNLVDGQLALNKTQSHEQQQQVTDGLACLKSFSTRFLATLCNNFTSPDPQVIAGIVEQVQKKPSSSAAGLAAAAKNQVLQTFHEKETQKCEMAIKSYVQIAEAKAVDSYFMNLVGTLLKLQTEKANTPKDTAKVVDPVAELQSQLRTYNIIDLLLILLPHLTAAKNLASSSLASSLMAENSPIFLLYRVLVGQLRDTDVTLEKRTYKALNAVVQLLLPSADVVSQISASRAQQVLPLVEDLVSKLIDPEVLAICSSGAKKARMELIAKVVESIPLSCDIVYSNSLSIISSADAPITLGDDVLLSFIPIALSEVMLCTKEASEKARTAAFETLAVMASKMLSAGKKFGTHNQTNDASMLETSGMDDEDMTSTESVEKEDTGAAKDKLNFREFMMMVVAGLAGASAGMQSSSISCVARLIFEFRDEMSDALIDDLVTTVMFMIKSRNNEVIKAALGFVKVVVVSVEPELLADHLENMVVSILVHSRTHSSHFKVKVRHILERLIRKFSFEAVEGFIPEEDKKLIVNIRKRRERAKRKKDSMMDEDVAEKADQSTSKNTGSAAATKNNKQKAFEDVMLNSDESDLGSDDEDNLEDYLPEDMKSGVSSSKKKSSKVQAPTKILEDNLGDEVLDFLNSNVVSRVTSGARSQSKKTMQATGAGVRDEFEFNSKGRLIIHDSDEEEKDNKKKKASSSSSSLMETDENQQEADGDLYMKSLTSEAAMQRMASGKMRLVNKRKRDEDDNDEPMDLDQDEDMVDPKQVAAEKRKKAEEKALNQMLGRQYKAKNARGDVKKGNLDPYAYIPLDAKIGGKSRKKAKSQGQFKNIIKAAQRGADVKSKRGGGGHGIKKSNKKHNK